MKKNVVIGLGEIGNPIYKLLSKGQVTVGFDKDSTLMNQSKFKKLEKLITNFLHVSILVNKSFQSNIIKLKKKFEPECIVIHSTVSPGTTSKLQKKLSTSK